VHVSAASPPAPSPWSARFDRQTRFAPIGRAGQQRLEQASVLIVGCGALGGAAAHALARCGIGRLVLADRDVVEESNLPRQVLFTPAQIGMPKVEAAAASLAALGGPTRVETHALHVDARVLRRLGDASAAALERAPDAARAAALAAEPAARAGIDLVLDGTDNLATRYLLNDWSVQQRRPWIYAGVVGSSGLVLGVRPGSGPCLRCLFPEPAPAGSLETCESAGVILPAVQVIASLQVALALRWLTESAPSAEPRECGASAEPEARADAAAADRARASKHSRSDSTSASEAAHTSRERLLRVDVWNGELGALDVERDPDCPCCGLRRFDFLDAPAERAPVVLCGRNTVQIQAPGTSVGAPLDTAALCRRLATAGVDVRRAGSLLRFEVEHLRFTVFPDGRALLEGTQDEGRARALYDRWIGR
jgi:adenylyltransferase/sulfurtransferase